MFAAAKKEIVMCVSALRLFHNIEGSSKEEMFVTKSATADPTQHDQGTSEGQTQTGQRQDYPLQLQQQTR